VALSDSDVTPSRFTSARHRLVALGIGLPRYPLWGQRGVPISPAPIAAVVLNLLLIGLIARLYSPMQVGFGAVLIVAVVAVGEIGELGIGEALQATIPGSNRVAGRLLAGSYGLAISVSAVMAVAVIATMVFWIDALAPIGETPWAVVVFPIAAPLWALYLLGHRVMAALGMAKWMSVKVVAVPFGQLVLAGGFRGSTNPVILLAVWVIPIALAEVAVAVALVRHLRATAKSENGAPVYRPDKADTSLAVRDLWQTVGHSWLGWVLDTARFLVAGVIVVAAVARLGPELGAAWFVAMVLAATVHSGLYHFGSSPQVAGHRLVGGLGEIPLGDAVGSAETVRQTNLGLAFSLPLVGLATWAAPHILGFLGDQYRVEGAWAAQLLILAAFPSVALSAHLARYRAARWSTRTLPLELLVLLNTLVFGLILLGAGGLPGLAWVWLLLSIIGGIVALIDDLVWWWGPRIGTDSARTISRLTETLARAKARYPNREANRSVNNTLEQIYTTAPEWERVESQFDSQVVKLPPHEGKPPLRLEVAETPWGAEILERRVKAVSELSGLTGLASLRALVPYPIDHHVDVDNTYLVESAVSGLSGLVIRERVLAAHQVEKIKGAVDNLHQATIATTEMDSEALDQWVKRPLQSMAVAARLDQETVERFRETMTSSLEGKRVETGTIHGNLLLDHARFDESGRLAGVLRWEWSQHGPLFIDSGTLALSGMAATHNTEIGTVVAELMSEPARFVEHAAMTGVDFPFDEPRGVILTVWLAALLPQLRGSATKPVSAYWIARNITQPALALDRWLARS